MPLMSMEQRIKKYNKVTERVTERVTEKEQIITKLIKENQNITISDIVEYMKISRKSVNINIKKLKEKEIIKRIGSDRGGYWEIIK